MSSIISRDFSSKRNSSSSKRISEAKNQSNSSGGAGSSKLIIGKNIPLSEFIKWILNFGNFGLLEFIPKNDQTVQKMFLTKEDIYRDYSEENFEKQLSNNADIINKFKLSDSNRIIYEYKSI